MKPTLLVLAAGMGSRYGGLKQVDPMGPSGETVLDYSVYDALRAGFGRVVFVIRRDFEKEFRDVVLAKYAGRVDATLAFQQLDMLPGGFSVPAGREKPWGTAHAIWCARDQVAEPFVMINADDFYGLNSFEGMVDFFAGSRIDAQPMQFSMAGYRLGATLSEHGSVARGVCTTDADGFLTGLEECTAIEKTPDGIRYARADGSVRTFTGEDPASMNFFGFTPQLFGVLDELLTEFLRVKGSEMKSEFYIPMVVSDLVKAGRASCKVVPTTSTWFGVTYREDKPKVQAALRELIAAGEYPERLWG
jgi:hypothetical protein